MQVLASIDEFRAARKDCTGSVGLVPTMGSLHDGHFALVRQARRDNQVLAVSIFVNPSQFGSDEDFDTYPRNSEQDLDLLRIEGVNMVFNPSSEEMYPAGFQTWIDLPSIGQRLEGKFRPSHFRGVATVVSKLLHVVAPDVAYFGQKDCQQVAVIRRMVADLNMDVAIKVVPTIREPDGLAMSSRNANLNEDERAAATIVYKSISQAQKMWNQGEQSGAAIRNVIRQMLQEEPLVLSIDYVSVADPINFDEMDIIEVPAMVSVAVRIGSTRLIDNILLD